MIRQYKNVEVTVNGTGLLAQSVSINSSPSLIPVDIISNFVPYHQTFNGPINNSISVNYIVNVNQEPNYNMIDVWSDQTKHQSFSYEPITVNALGLSSECYIRSYNLRVDPSDVITANVEYVSFTGFNGELSDKGSSTIFLPIDSGISGIGHGWTSYIPYNASDPEPINLNLDLSWEGEWIPTYTIGNHAATQVQLGNVRQTLAIETTGIGLIPNISGDGSRAFLGWESQEIRLYPIGTMADPTYTDDYLSFIIGLDGKLTSTVTETTNNDVVKTKITSVKYRTA